MKKQDTIFGILKVLLDIFVVIASFFIARELRLLGDFIPGLHLQVQTIDTYNLIFYSIIAAFVVILVFSIHGLYKMKTLNSKIKEFLNIFLYGFYSFVFFTVISYLGQGFIFDKEIPRLIILYAFIIAIFGIILQRIFLNNLQYFLINKNFFSKNNLVLITDKNEKDILEILNDIKKANIYKIIGYSNLKKQEKSKMKFLNFKNLKRKIKNRKIDEIIFMGSDFSKEELYDIWELTRIFNVRYRYLTNNFDITKTNTELSLINEIPVLELKSTSLSGWNIILKRIFDIFISFFGIIIFSPILLLTYFFIKTENFKAPAIFKNKRVGKDGKTFNLYKFRYMKWQFCTKDSYNVSKKEKQKALIFEQKLIEKKSTRKGPLYKIENDPRKTKFGTFIEKYSIDELPQLFNVFLGNMSLVGPRPHQPREVDKYLLKHKRVLTIKPGITGMAQVNGREKNDFNKEAELDIYYIENWSILLDLKIIVKTFVHILYRAKK